MLEEVMVGDLVRVRARVRVGVRVRVRVRVKVGVGVRVRVRIRVRVREQGLGDLGVQVADVEGDAWGGAWDMLPMLGSTHLLQDRLCVRPGSLLLQEALYGVRLPRRRRWR